jgi:peptidoglycan/xylan/chitin deacetylase (PgdA/CDA1 family)
VKGICTFTFDDGPDPIWTPRVLAELDRCDVQATFFMIGERLVIHPDLARSVVEAGHDVELHCHRHIPHTELSNRQLESDTRSALSAFEQAGLPQPARWRPPWGIRTQATGLVSSRHALELVHWTIDTHDWRGDTSAEMLEASGVGLRDAAVVLMHDALAPGAQRAGCRETVGLIAPLATAAKECGLRISPLSQTDSSFAGPPARS